jgi:xylan 1,4-beta-xylosidase
MITRAVMTVCVCLAILQAPAERVTIRVDAGARRAPMTQMWAFFGYDEPNYTYTPNGKKLLSELAELSPVPCSSGRTTCSRRATARRDEVGIDQRLHRGRGRAADLRLDDRRSHPRHLRRAEDEAARRDRLHAGSAVDQPDPYRHDWRRAGSPPLYTGWSYPPKDYDKWRELITQWAAHRVERYGRAKSRAGTGRSGTSPTSVLARDARGIPEAVRLRRGRPEARAADGAHRRAARHRAQRRAHARGSFQAFLEHCLRGTNYATGKIGSPLDYIGFHAKGAPRFVDGHVRHGASAISCARSPTASASVASFPELRDTPIIIGESDPEGMRRRAECRPTRRTRTATGTVYSSYTAAQLARNLRARGSPQGQSAAARSTVGLRVRGPARTSPASAISRPMGIDKPVLNVFRMLGRMLGDRVTVESSGALPLDLVRDTGVRDRPTSTRSRAAASAPSRSSSGTITTTTWRRGAGGDLLIEACPEAVDGDARSRGLRRTATPTRREADGIAAGADRAQTPGSRACRTAAAARAARAK